MPWDVNRKHQTPHLFWISRIPGELREATERFFYGQFVISTGNRKLSWAGAGENPSGPTLCHWHSPTAQWESLLVERCQRWDQSLKCKELWMFGRVKSWHSVLSQQGRWDFGRRENMALNRHTSPIKEENTKTSSRLITPHCQQLIAV